MKALIYNVTLLLPLAMFIVWAVITIIRDKDFANQIISFQQSTGATQPESGSVCVAAANAFYETDGRFSVYKYINATWKHKAMLYKAISLCLILDFMQHDDGSIASGHYFDNLNIDFLASFVIAFIGALVFDYLFFRFVFKEYLVKSGVISKMLIASVSTWIFLVIAGAITTVAIVSALGDEMMEYGINKPIEYVVGQIFSPSSFLWVGYAFTVLQTKIAMGPVVLLLFLSSFSFALSVVVYIAMHYTLKSQLLRNSLVRITVEIQKTEGIIKSRALLVLNYIQKAYWIFLISAVARALYSGQVL